MGVYSSHSNIFLFLFHILFHHIVFDHIVIPQYFFYYRSFYRFQQWFLHQIQWSRKWNLQWRYTIHQLHTGIQKFSHIIYAAPYLRYATIYAQQSVNSFHCCTYRIFCGEDSIPRCLSELSKECEVHAAIRDNIRSVSFCSWHEECGDVWHHGRYADCTVICPFFDLICR